MDVSAALGAPSTRLKSDGPKVYHLPAWDGYADPKRLDVIARIAKMRGHDPQIATLAVSILKRAGAAPRQYKKQAAALLHYVQNDLYYVNEPGERLQDPLYTLKVGYGDCDDLVIMLAALLESIRLPWKLVISGTKGRKKVRYHQGDKFPGAAKKGYNWSHIYVMIGDRPFVPEKWYYAETTLRGAPLGWDVVDGDASTFPELQNNYGATTMSYEILEYGAMQMQTNTASTPGNDLQLPQALTVQPSSIGNSLVVTQGQDPGGQRRLAHSGYNQRPRLVHAAQGEQQANMVAIVVVGPRGRVLALHRNPGAKWMGGKWDLPGGKTHGLPARAAAVKILAAETGLKVNPKRLRACSAVYHPSAGTSVFYVLRLQGKREIQVAAKEHQGFKFVSRSVLMRRYQTAPYVAIAFRACFKPQSLSTYTKTAPVIKKGMILPSAFANANLSTMNLLQSNVSKDGNYAGMEMMEGTMYGLPKWAVLTGVAGAGYYFFVHKKKKGSRKRRK